MASSLGINYMFPVS